MAVWGGLPPSVARSWLRRVGLVRCVRAHEWYSACLRSPDPRSGWDWRRHLSVSSLLLSSADGGLGLVCRVSCVAYLLRWHCRSPTELCFRLVLLARRGVDRRARHVVHRIENPCVGDGAIARNLGCGTLFAGISGLCGLCLPDKKDGTLSDDRPRARAHACACGRLMFGGMLPG